jgi:hypothetical protein
MMKEFSGELIQKGTTFIETAELEPSQLPATKTENKDVVYGSRWFKWLKKLSFGQYRTPLYYNKQDSWSSIIGGVVTIAVMVLILIFAIVTLVPIF